MLTDSRHYNNVTGLVSANVIGLVVANVMSLVSATHRHSLTHITAITTSAWCLQLTLSGLCKCGNVTGLLKQQLADVENKDAVDVTSWDQQDGKETNQKHRRRLYPLSR